MRVTCLWMSVGLALTLTRVPLPNVAVRKSRRPVCLCYQLVKFGIHSGKSEEINRPPCNAMTHVHGLLASAGVWLRSEELGDQRRHYGPCDPGTLYPFYCRGPNEYCCRNIPVATGAGNDYFLTCNFFEISD